MFGIDRCEEVKSSRVPGEVVILDVRWVSICSCFRHVDPLVMDQNSPRHSITSSHRNNCYPPAQCVDRDWALRYFYALSPAAALPAPPHSSNFWPHSWGWHCHHWTELYLWPLTVQLEVWLSVVPSRNSGVRIPVLSLLPGFVNTPRNDH